ncbi:MAG: hypothetical protein KC978_04535, partial [Candidatus Omnitrophica bacterium]|nr:hypothetical protein [Candidatus Omnitrophota bacterium]
EYGGRRKWVWIATCEEAELEIEFNLPGGLEVRAEETTWWPRFYVEEKIIRLDVVGEIGGSSRVVTKLTGFPSQKKADSIGESGSIA